MTEPTRGSSSVMEEPGSPCFDHSQKAEKDLPIYLSVEGQGEVNTLKSFTSSDASELERQARVQQEQEMTPLPGSSHPFRSEIHHRNPS